MYKLAIFDFDGTLVDSAPGIVEVMEKVVQEHDLSPQVLEKWRHLIGVPLGKQMDIIFPEKNDKYRVDMADRYRAIYDSQAIEICPPFPGLKDVLLGLQLAEVDIAIVSSKRRHLIEIVLDYHNLSSYFRLVLGQQDVSNHKPHPESVHHALDKLKVEHVHAVVIGDSTYDLDMARAAGVDAIGVTTGIHTRQILLTSEPAHIVDKLDDVLPIILRGKQTNGTKDLVLK